MRLPGSSELKLTVAAVAAAVTGSLVLLVLPVYGSSTNGGPEHEQTLLEYEGAHVLALLALPVALTAIPLALPHRLRRNGIRIIAVLAVLFVLITGFTIGMFYAPAAVLLVLAARASGQAASSAR